MKIIHLLCKIILLINLSINNYTFAEEKVDIVEEAKSLLSTHNEDFLLINAISFFSKNFANKNLTELLISVWNSDKNKYPDFAWEVLNSEKVRLEYGSLLAQWLRETSSHTELIGEIKIFIIPYRNHPTEELRLKAVSFTVNSNQQDINKLEDIIIHDKRVISVAAMYAILEIQGEKGKEILNNLKDKISDDNKKEMLELAIKNADKLFLFKNRSMPN
ncbi:MAG: hypothetical protein R3F53_25140 [Gammaproteobacteria bacterium]